MKNQLTLATQCAYEANSTIGVSRADFIHNACVSETRSRTSQWSYSQTGTMGALASQAEISVWVPAPGALLRGPDPDRAEAPRRREFLPFKYLSHVFVYFIP